MLILEQLVILITTDGAMPQTREHLFLAKKSDRKYFI
jgi:translation elongation factor EF-Tu-like GTPase